MHTFHWHCTVPYSVLWHCSSCVCHTVVAASIAHRRCPILLVTDALLVSHIQAPMLSPYAFGMACIFAVAAAFLAPLALAAKLLQLLPHLRTVLLQGGREPHTPSSDSSGSIKIRTSISISRDGGQQRHHRRVASEAATDPKSENTFSTPKVATPSG